MELQEQIDLLFQTLQPGFALLFVGFTGLGKTHYTNYLSKKFNLPLQNWDDVSSTTYLPKIYFIDEIQRFSEKVQAGWFPEIDAGGERDTFWDQGELKVKFTPIKYIFATTDLGKVHPALISRCYQVQFSFLKQDEMYNAIKEKTNYPDDLIYQAISIADGTPRNGIKIAHAIKMHGFEKAKALQGLDVNGLNNFERGYLIALYGKKLSVDKIAQILGLDKKGVSDRIEPRLARMGLISISSSGRILTPQGNDMYRTYFKEEM